MLQNSDEVYMQRAIDLARLGMGNHAPNPRVGAVIVHQDRIIGEGYHEQYGQAHAEVNAVAAVMEEDKHLLNQATIYVTLEPCFHYGKTPPCVNLLLKHNIPRVVIACQDTSAKVGGKSIQKLRDNGVEVVVGVLEKQAKQLARRFLTNIHQKRPYVVLKFAQSADGYIGQHGKEVAISDVICKRLVHQWRVAESAIMVGTNTALVDNPQLNARHYFGNDPIRIVLDRKGKLEPTANLLDGTQPTIVFTEKKEQYILPNVEWVMIDFGEQMLEKLLVYLYTQGIQSVLVEGGAGLIHSFLEAGLWDEGRVITSPSKIYSGIAAPVLPLSQKENTMQLGSHICAYYFNTKL